MRFVVVMVALVVAMVVVRRIVNQRAHDEALSMSERHADKGWQAETVGSKYDRGDIQVEGATPAGRRFVAHSSRAGDEFSAVEATVTFPDLAASVRLPTAQRKKGKVTLRGKGDADESVLRTTFASDGLAHLDQVRGALLRSLKHGEGPVVFQVSRLAANEENLSRTIECLDALVTLLQQAGYLDAVNGSTAN